MRVSLESLMPHLSAKGKDLNEKIAFLVDQGLPKNIQQALDSIRVIGNNAIHPGQIDIHEDPDIALALFRLLNLIVEKMISDSKKIEEIYNILPDHAIKAINKRDANE
jgi:hypothetical protein